MFHGTYQATERYRKWGHIVVFDYVEHAGTIDFPQLRRTSAPVIRDAIGTAIGDAPVRCKPLRCVIVLDGWF